MSSQIKVGNNLIKGFSNRVGKEIYYIYNKTGFNELWKVNISTKENRQVTFLNKNIDEMVISEDGNDMLLGIDPNGKEELDWYIMNLNNHDLKKVDFPCDGIYTPILNANGLWYIIYNNNEFSVVKTIATSDFVDFEHCISDYEVLYVHSKGNWFLEERETSHSYRYNYYINNGEIRYPLISQTTVIDFCGYEDQLFLAEEKDDEHVITKYDLKEKSAKKIIGFSESEIDFLEINGKDNRLYIVLHKGVKSLLLFYDLNNDSLFEYEYPGTLIEQLAVMDQQVYILAIGRNDPHNVYSIVPELYKLTNNSGSSTMPVPDHICFDSSDNLKIEALLYTPEEPNGHAIALLHGGPHDCFRDVSSEEIQFMIKMGFHVFLPNVRGSTGYGVKFRKQSYKDWGSGPCTDLMNGLNFIKSHTSVKDFILVGRSYGGYLALLAACENSECLIGAVNFFGPTDLISLIKNAPPYWRSSIQYELGTLENDYHKLYRDSPINYVEKLKIPICIIYGENDPRIDAETNIHPFIKELKNRNKEYVDLCLREQGHGFDNSNDGASAYNTVMNFIDFCVGKKVES